MKLDLYLIRRFLSSFLIVLSVMGSISMLLEMTELVRKHDVNQIKLLELFKISLLHLPEMMYRILPLIILLSTLAMYLSLSKTSELVIIRASSRSALRSLVGPVSTTFVIGITSIFFLNPIIATTSKYHATKIDKITNSSKTVTAVLNEGLWMRQDTINGQIIIQARKSDPTATFFNNLSIYGFDKKDRPIYRLKAESASLAPGVWNLRNVKYWNFNALSDAGVEGINFPEFSVSAYVTPIQIIKGFSPPNTIIIWELPKLITRLDQAGFPSIKHKIWFQMELANPLFLVSMVLIASAFVTRHARVSNPVIAIIVTLILGFSVYFLKNFANVLGQNLQIPVYVAAWVPPLAGVFLSLGYLLHIEDG